MFTLRVDLVGVDIETSYITSSGILFAVESVLLVAVAVLAVFGISSWLKWRKKCQELQTQFDEQRIELEREYETRMLSKQMQYSALQNQINPHFLYNTLESIRGEALINGNQSVADMTQRLSRFFRYFISNKGDVVTLRDEINNVLDYFYIQKYRFGEKFQLSLNVDEACYAYQLPKMTLQPIVENAVYHGLERKKQGGTVAITVFETNINMVVQISDDGVGIDENVLHELNDRLKNHNLIDNRKNERKTGIALHNVNTRIRLQYGDDYGLHLRSVHTKGTDVIIVIPRTEQRV